MSRRRQRHQNNDGLGFPVWASGLIASAGSAIAGAVATKIADGGASADEQRAAVDRSLTYQFEYARRQEQQQQQTVVMVGLGLGAVLLISLLR